ncbi:MAG: 50S ribosomal protein L15 [Sandaracinus sp.]|nr:50S ribosomal protein L15 [Sandaracinus sp.]|tara:strand:- start:3445 stop:3948 length:504 start_codon:yes stop_codon:yes gene_type:complete
MADNTTNDETEVPILSRLRPPVGAVKKKKRKGRGVGSGLGKTAGKGMKGQKARHPGDFSKLGFEGGQTPLYRRLPKRGFGRAPFAKKVVTFNVSDLERFDAGATVDLEALRSSGLLSRKVDAVKILGDGELSKKLTVKAHGFSKSARSKIEAAGGSCEELAAPKAEA